MATHWNQTFTRKLLKSLFFLHIVGNKAKGQISKWVFQENKVRQIFRKTNFSYPLMQKVVLLFYFVLFQRGKNCGFNLFFFQILNPVTKISTDVSVLFEIWCYIRCSLSYSNSNFSFAYADYAQEQRGRQVIILTFFYCLHKLTGIHYFI